MADTSLQDFWARLLRRTCLRREADGDVGSKSGAETSLAPRTPPPRLPRPLAATTAHAEATAARCAPATKSTMTVPKLCEGEEGSRKRSFAPGAETLAVALHAPAAAAKREKLASDAPQ